MNKILSTTLRCLGLRRPVPKTRVGRCLRQSERVLTVVGCLYMGLHAFPQVLMAHSVTVDGITVYSAQPIPEDGVASIRRATELLERSELFVEGGRQKVFVCNSEALYRFFSPWAPSSFGISVPITNHVFLASAEFSSDTAVRFGEGYDTRSLSGLLAHEVTHGLIRDHLGLIKTVRIPTWVCEGYCEVVAGGGSFPDEKGIELLVSGRDDPSSSFRYFCYRKIVSHLMDHRGMSFDELSDGSIDFEEAKEEFRRCFLEARSQVDQDARGERRLW